MTSSPAPQRGRKAPNPRRTTKGRKLLMPLSVPSSLHPETQSLVLRFAAALAEKLAKAEEKYGYSDGWQQTEWIENGECQRKLVEHTAKGDPRDVAAYCAFLWYHEASTTPDATRTKSAFERLTFAEKVEAIAQTAYEADYCPQAEPEWCEMKDDGPVRLAFTQRARAILSLLGEVQK